MKIKLATLNDLKYIESLAKMLVEKDLKSDFILWYVSAMEKDKLSISFGWCPNLILEKELIS